MKPKRNFGLGTDGGPGAWEVALRYSTLDLNYGWWPRGGKQESITGALNWHLNPNAKVKFEYVRADVSHDLYGGNADIFQTRIQFAF